MKSSMSCKSHPLPWLQNNKSLDLFFIFLEMPPCEHRLLGIRIFLQITSVPLVAISVERARFVSQDEHYLADAEIPLCNANKQLSPCWGNCNKTFLNRAPTQRRLERNLPHQAKPVKCTFIFQGQPSIQEWSGSVGKEGGIALVS